MCLPILGAPDHTFHYSDQSLHHVKQNLKAKNNSTHPQSGRTCCGSVTIRRQLFTSLRPAQLEGRPFKGARGPEARAAGQPPGPGRLNTRPPLAESPHRTSELILKAGGSSSYESCGWVSRKRQFAESHRGSLPSSWSVIMGEGRDGERGREGWGGHKQRPQIPSL